MNPISGRRREGGEKYNRKREKRKRKNRVRVSRLCFFCAATKKCVPAGMRGGSQDRFLDWIIYQQTSRGCSLKFRRIALVEGSPMNETTPGTFLGFGWGKLLNRRFSAIRTSCPFPCSHFPTSSSCICTYAAPAVSVQFIPTILVTCIPVKSANTSTALSNGIQPDKRTSCSCPCGVNFPGSNSSSLSRGKNPQPTGDTHHTPVPTRSPALPASRVPVSSCPS